MSFFLSKRDVRAIVREELAPLLTHLININNRLNIMPTQAELTEQLTAKTAQVRKAIDEITTRLAALEEAVRNSPATPELTAAVAALGVAVQAAYYIVPDAPPA